MLAGNAFNKTGDSSELKFVKPNARDVKKREISACHKKTVEENQIEAREAFEKLITHFDRADSAYFSQPRAQYTNPYGDYDHLARRAEWAKLGSDGNEGSSE